MEERREIGAKVGTDVALAGRKRGGPKQYDVSLGSVRAPQAIEDFIQAERERRYAAGQPCAASDVQRDLLAAAALGACGDVSRYVNAVDVLRWPRGERADWLARVNTGRA